jgi:cystathionine gamma-synthase
MALLAPGQTVALAEGAYFGTGVSLREFEPWGLRVIEFDQTGAPPDANVMFVEAPANPVLTMPNWDALHGRGVVVCDATLSTPIYLRALDEGADVVLHSATKYLTGHSDAMLGALVIRDAELGARLRDVRTRIGLHAAPEAAGALLRGLEDLDERLRRQTETATELARRLVAHPSVVLVRYPGFAGVISFDVAGDPLPVETSTTLIRNQTSLGGVKTSMESRHRWEGDRIPRGLLRLSVGLENVDEIWADLEQALSNA